MSLYGKRHSAPYKSVDGRVYDKEYNYYAMDSTPKQGPTVKETISFSGKYFRQLLGFLSGDDETFRSSKPLTEAEKNRIVIEYGGRNFANKNAPQYSFKKKELLDALKRDFPAARAYTNIYQIKAAVDEKVDIFSTLKADELARHDRFSKDIREVILDVENPYLWEKNPFPRRWIEEKGNFSNVRYITSISEYMGCQSNPYSYYLAEYKNGHCDKAITKKELELFSTRRNYAWGFFLEGEYKAMIDAIESKKNPLHPPQVSYED